MTMLKYIFDVLYFHKITVQEPNLCACLIYLYINTFKFVFCKTDIHLSIGLGIVST